MSGRSTLPMGGCTTQTDQFDYMDIASENQPKNFYFPVKYMVGNVDIYIIGKDNPRRMKNDDALHDFWNVRWF